MMAGQEVKAREFIESKLGTSGLAELDDELRKHDEDYDFISIFRQALAQLPEDSLIENWESEDFVGKILDLSDPDAIFPRSEEIVSFVRHSADHLSFTLENREMVDVKRLPTSRKTLVNITLHHFINHFSFLQCLKKSLEHLQMSIIMPSPSQLSIPEGQYILNIKQDRF